MILEGKTKDLAWVGEGDAKGFRVDIKPCVMLAQSMSHGSRMSYWWSKSYENLQMPYIL